MLVYLMRQGRGNISVKTQATQHEDPLDLILFTMVSFI